MILMKASQVDGSMATSVASVLSNLPLFSKNSLEDLKKLASRGILLETDREEVELAQFEQPLTHFVSEIFQRYQQEKMFIPFLLVEGMIVFFEKGPRNNEKLNLFEISAPFIGYGQIERGHGYVDPYKVSMQPKSKAFIFDPYDIRQLAEKNPEIISKVFLDKNRITEAFSMSTRIFLSPTTKLKIAKYLYFHAERRQKKGYPPILDNVTQEMFASSFGVSRTTVSEAFMELKGYGAIEPKYRKILVNPEKCKVAIEEFSRDILEK